MQGRPSSLRIIGPTFCLWWAAIGLALAVTATPAWADDSPSSETASMYREGAEALSRGEYEKALVLFEALADRGFAHPDASFNRGVAYVTRYREGAGKPGDLGRAAAAFEETLALRRSDPDAEHALDLVRAEVTRQRSRRAKDAVDVRPTLDRLVVGLATERSWGVASLVASLLLAIGLVLRLRPSGPAHVAGSVLAPSALVALLVLVPLTWGARHLRLHKRDGVVVVSEVHVVDSSGKTLDEAIPEAAKVEVGVRRGALLQVRWGASEGWVPVSSVRVLQR